MNCWHCDCPMIRRDDGRWYCPNCGLCASFCRAIRRLVGMAKIAELARSMNETEVTE